MEYTAGNTPVKDRDVDETRNNVSPVLREMQIGGRDGLDVALGTIKALRAFVLYNVGPEAIDGELENLAVALKAKW